MGCGPLHVRWRKSVGVDAGFFDDGLPLLDFRLQVRVQRFGIGLCQRHRLGAEIGEARREGRILF